MKKILLLFLVVAWTAIYPSDNTAYLRQASGTWKLGLLNGKTTSAGNEITIDNIYLKNNTKPIYTCGDFDNDGSTEALVITNGPISAPKVSVECYDVGDQMSPNSNLKKWTYVLNDRIANFQRLLFCENIGDLNGNGSDEILFIYENSDNFHWTAWIIDAINNSSTSESVQLFSYIHILDKNEGSNILYATTGDFEGNGKKELNIIYDHVSGAFQTERTFDFTRSTSDWLRSYRHLANKGNMETILFVTKGYFSAVPREQLAFVYDNPNVNTETLTVFDIPDCQIVTNVHINFLSSSGKIEFMTSGDYKGTGRDELAVVFRTSKTGTGYTIKVHDVPSCSTLATQNFSLSTNYSEEIKAVVSGDYIGEGYSTINLFHGKSDDTYSGFRNYDVKNSKISPATSYYLYTKLDLATVNISLKYAISAGASTRYNPYHLDKYYTPITEGPNSPNKTFYIGWYDGGASTERAKTLANNSSTNAYLPYLAAGVGLGQGDALNCLKSVDDSLLPSLSTQFPKKILVQVYQDIGLDNDLQYPITNDISWKTDLDSIKKITKYGTDKYNYIGYYTGDDCWGRATRISPPPLYKWTDFNSFNNYMAAYDLTHYRFAAETSGNFTTAYNSGISIDIPMEEEYIYHSYNVISPDPYKYDHYNNNYQRVDISLQQEILRDNVRKHNQPGFIYIAQAHGDGYQSSFGVRPATWHETRYDVFNSIINGAGGIFFWAYGYSDDLRRTHVEHIVDEITSHKAYTDTNNCGTLYKALLNGHCDFPVFCSKDGYNGDYEQPYVRYDYTGVGDPFIGRGVSDINYIVRSDNNIYYLIVANNSKLNVNNIKYYLPLGLKGNAYISKICIDSVGNHTIFPMSQSTAIKNGKSFTSFTEGNMSPFSINIYRISNSATFSKSLFEEDNANKRVNSIKESFDYELYQNYPNPFNPTTQIKYSLKENMNVVLKVYNNLGQEVKTLVNGYQSAGVNSVTWDGTNNFGSMVPSGIYFYRIQTGNFTKSCKMLLVK